MGVVVVVAGGVTAVLDIESFVVDFLCLSACEVAFTLLGHNVGDEALFGLEIVAHGLGFVGRAVVLEHGCAESVADRVHTAHGIDIGIGEIHLYLLCVELESAVFDFGAAIHVCIAAADNHH